MPQPNRNTVNSSFQVQVTAGAGNADLSASLKAAYVAASKTPPAAELCCTAIRLHAAGTLVYTNRDGVVVTLTSMPAGLEPIEAAAIGSGTNVNVTCYF